MIDDAGSKIQEFVESIAESLRMRHDSKGNPIGDLLPGELAAILEYVLAIAGSNEANWRYALEIGSETRKHLIIFGGILPLISASAENLGRDIIFLAPDSGGESRARLEYKAMMTLATTVHFANWDDLQPKPENGFGMANLNRYWVIGDLDWSARPIEGEIGDLKKAAIQRVLADKNCPVLLLHQQNKTPIIPLPSNIGV